MDGSEKQILSSNLNNMSLNVKSENLKNVKVERGTSRSQYKPEKWMLDQLEERLSQLNLAIVSLPPYIAHFLIHITGFSLLKLALNIGSFLSIFIGWPC